MNNDYGGNRASRCAGHPAVMAAVAVLTTATARGSSASLASASLAGAASGVSADHKDQQDGSQLLNLAQCMRAHGVPRSLDPTVSGGSVMLHGTFDFGSPQFQNAERARKPLIPAGLFPPANWGEP